MLLSHAKTLFEFADKHRGIYNASYPFYISYDYKDELLWAAAWLYKATGDNQYLNYVIINKDWSQAVTEFSWENKFAGAQALLASEFYDGKTDLANFKNDVESFVCALMPGSSSQLIKPTPGGLMFTRNDSNLQYVTTATTVLFHYAKTLTKAGVGSIQCGSTQFTVSQIQEFAKTQVDYILRNNPMQMSYMVGFGTQYPTQPHHRGSSIPSIQSKPEKIDCAGGNSYLSSDQPNPNVHTGAIVGGPDLTDYFSDKRSDYSHAEPTTYINAAFIGPVAALIGGNSDQNTVINTSGQTHV